MTLRLVIEHSPTPQPRGEFRVAGGDVSIGRGAECDWQLDDAEMFVSRRHCIVSVRDGEFTVTDASRGGLFVDGAPTPLGTGNSARIEHGTRLRLGDIVIRVEAEAGAPQAAPRAAARPDSALTFDGDDFFAPRAPASPPPPRPAGLPEPFDSGRASPGVAAPAAAARPTLPAFDDPFSLDPLTAPVQAPQPQPLPQTAPAMPTLVGAPSADDIFARPAAAPEPTQPQRAAVPLSLNWDAGPPEDAPSRVVVRAPAARPDEGPADQARPDALQVMPPPVATLAPGAPPAPAAAAATAPSAAPADGAFLTAFLSGLGLDPATLPVPPATPAEAEALGRRFRLLTDGLVQLLRARAKEKGSVRVAQTIIGSADVNPLKFLATTDDALAALITPRGKGYLAPEDAITGAYRDLTDHQLRTWVAVQSALRGMIDRFDPEAFEQEADADGTLKAILAGGRGARLWQLYRTRYREIAKAAEERFLGEVGADFRDAYEGTTKKRDEP